MLTSLRRAPRLKLRAWTPTETERVKEARKTLRHALPQRAQLIHYPAGIEASPAAWNRMRALGAVSGFPDQLLLLDGRAFTLEFKTDEGEETPSQIAYAPFLEAAGIPRAVVTDGPEALVALAAMGVPLWGTRQREELPSRWRLVLGEWLAAVDHIKRAFALLCETRPPAGRLHAMRFELDAALRQLHANTH